MAALAGGVLVVHFTNRKNAPLLFSTRPGTRPILAEFPSVISATECAVQIQTVMAERSAGVPEHRRMRLRVGINLGDVIHNDARIYGDGINIAARLETLAEPGGILVSSTVYDPSAASCLSLSRMRANGSSRTSSSPCERIGS